MKKQYKSFNIRTNDLFFKQLDYLRNRLGTLPKDFPFPYRMTRSEYIRHLVEKEYYWALDLDSRSE